MSFTVTIIPANITFTTNGEDNILASALQNKINLPHGCKSGNCGACKCKITSGEVTHDTEINPSTLTYKEQEDGIILLCKAHAQSNITVEIPGFTNGFPIKILPAKISSLEKIGTTAIVKLKLPAAQTFQFYAGQYIDIIYDGQNRSYSLANAPTDNNELELHIRYRPGGLFSVAVWESLQIGDIIRFKGPLGNFTAKDSDKPMIMLCTGTGFAPIKGIIEQLIGEQSKRKMHLIWGNLKVEDFYLTEILTAWQKELDLQITLCVDNDAPTGYHTGLVTDVIRNEYPDLSQHEVYACGNPQMIASLYDMAKAELNLVDGTFFSDSFTPSK